ncbi:hypothetical protein [Aureimonas endophytica]|nr:hypothetical protein [Aureimonas endophytica]
MLVAARIPGAGMDGLYAVLDRFHEQTSIRITGHRLTAASSRQNSPQAALRRLRFHALLTKLSMTANKRLPPFIKGEVEKRKLKAKRLNERLKLSASSNQALALAILSVGGLQYMFDPAAAKPDGQHIMLAVAAGFVLEIVAIYIVGKMKAEN